MKTISELVPFLNKEFKECEFVVNEDTIVCKCPKYAQKGKLYWEWDADAADDGIITLYAETKRSINDRAMALQLVNDYNKGLVMKDVCYDYCSVALTDNNTLRLKNAFLCYDRLTTDDYVGFYYAAMPTLAAMRVLDWWDDLAQKAEKGDLTKNNITFDDSNDDQEWLKRRNEGLNNIYPIGQISLNIAVGEMRKQYEEEEEEEKKKSEEDKKKREEEERKSVEEAKKVAEQQSKAMDLISAFFSRGEKEAREEAEEEARRKMEEEKKKAETARETEKANENKGQSLLKGLFGKKKASDDGMSKARGSVDKVIDDTVTRTIGGVTIRTSMKTILQEAAQGLKKSLYQEKENVFQLSSFRTGQFHYSYYREEKGFDVAVSFKSNEFENKEIAEKMRLDIKDYLKSQGFDDCEVVETKKVLIRKDIILRNKKEGDLIARIQNTTNLLIGVVQKIDEWRKWPEDKLHKWQRLIIESEKKIIELKSRVADCEADCARHQRDSYYTQKRAEAKADLQKEKIRLEKLRSWSFDLDEID